MWLKSSIKSFRSFARPLPEGYRTEAVRLELLYNLEMMESDERLTRGVQSLYEEPFSFELGEGATLKGTSIVSKWTPRVMRRSSTTKSKSKLGTDNDKKAHGERTHFRAAYICWRRANWAPACRHRFIAPRVHGSPGG